MPPIETLLLTWRLDPVPLIAIAAALALYLAAVRRIRRRGGHWPIGRTLAFAGLGLGAYAVVSFGFLGTFSGELRFAFTTRIALLLFVIPALVAIGRPLELTRRSLADAGTARLERALRTLPVRLFGNAMFATVFAALVFCLFLTPVAWIARGTPAIDSALSIVVPLVGLLMVVPIAENAQGRTTLFITVEFLLAFAELIIDAIPGIVLRITGTVLDGAPAIHEALSWWPSPLRDQQLSGDLLWFIAEVADVPILVLLFVRWARSDKRDAKSFDDLSDEELDALTREHLRGPRD